MLSRNRGYDRSRLLDSAARARARKKRGLAIELYRWVLAVEPQNASLHAKLAPLLAETGQHFDAWMSFRATARACLREGLTEKALAVYREAALYLPREFEAWQAIARLQRKRGRDRDAIETLLEGSRHFRTRWLKPQAIYLLRRARDIDSWDFETVIELARLLALTDQRAEGRILLDGLIARSQGHRLRRARAARFRLDPTPRHAWHWMRSAMHSDDDEPRRARSEVVLLHARAAKR